MPGAGGLPDLEQRATADLSPYIAEFRATLPVLREVNALQAEFLRGAAQVQDALRGFGGAPGAAAAAADIGRMNAQIREGLAAARDYQAQMSAVESTAGDVAAAHAHVAEQIAVLNAAIREETSAQQAQSAASAVTVEQIRAIASGVDGLTQAYSRLTPAQFEALNEGAMSVREVEAAIRALPAVYGDAQAAAMATGVAMANQERVAAHAAESVGRLAASQREATRTAGEFAAAQERAAAATVQVEARSVYGRQAYYPANDAAKLFAEIAGMKKQVPDWVLQLAGQLGYSVEGAGGFTGGAGVRSPDVVQVQTRTVYDRDLAYPANEAAEVFARLASTKTLTESTMKLIGDLGYTIEDLGKAAPAVLPLVENLAAVRDTARDVAAAVTDAAVATSGPLTSASLDAAAAARGFASYGDLNRASSAGLGTDAAAYYAASRAGGGSSGGAGPFLGGLAGGAAGGGGGSGGGGGGFFGSFFGGATAGLFSGGSDAAATWSRTASAIATWYPRIHWAMMLTNEVLATAGPAAIAALAGTAVGMEGGQTAFDRLTGVNAVGQSIGGSLGTTPGQFLGLGDSLQKAQTKADPQVWELMGAAINSVKASTDSASGGLGNFWQLGTNTIDMMDRFGAQVTLDFKHGLGDELAGAVQGGTQDLQQFGDVLGNVGDTFLRVIPSLPGVGSDLLSTLQFATKGLSDVAGFGASTGLLGPALALEAGSRYGPALVGGAASLIGRAGQGLTAAGATGLGGFLGTAARKATAADVGVTLNPATGAVVASEGELIGGTGVAGAVGGATALDVGLLAASAYVGTKALTYKTPEQQAAGALQAQVGTDSFTQAISDIASGINQLGPAAATAPSGLGAQAQNWPVIGGVVSTAMDIGHDFKTGGVSGGIYGLLRDTVGGLFLGPPPTSQQAAQSGVSGLTQQYQELLGAGKQIAQTFKVSVPEAFALADQAGLQLSTAVGAHGKLTAVALQQIMNTQTGLQAMTGGFGSGVYNEGVNAIQVAKGLQGSQLSTLNSAYDELVQNATQGTTAATGFSAGMQALSALALPAAQKAPSAKTVKDIEAALGVSSTDAREIAASGGTAKSVKDVAKALEGFTSPASQAAWTAFSSTSTSAPGMIQTVETMMDQLRTAQASGVLSQGQVAGAGAYEAKQLLPYARYSPAALSQLGIVSQEMGGPAYQAGESQAKNYAAISGAIDKASVSAKGYTGIQNTMAEGMSNVSQQALSFSSVLSSDMVDSMAAGATGAAGGDKAMREFAGSLKGGAPGFDTSALKGVVSQMKESGESLSSVKLMLGDVATLHGVSASALAGIVRGATADYQPPKAPPKLAGQTYDITPKVHPPVIPPAAPQTYEVTGHVRLPRIPKVPDQSFTIVGHVMIEGAGAAIATSTIAGGGGGMRLQSQHGMFVPGHGSGDIVPAMLEPGELVVPRGMVGAGAVDHLRGQIPGFAGGGLAGGEMQSTLTRATGMINSYGSSGGSLSSQQFGQMSSTFLQAAQLAHVMSSAAGFQGGGIVPAATLSGIKAQVNAEWQALDALYAQENAASGSALTALKSQIDAFWQNIMNPLYAAEDALTGRTSGSGAAASPATGGAAKSATQTAQQVLTAFEKTLTGEGAPWAQFGKEILKGLTDGIKGPETTALAQSLVSKVTTEVNYAKSVASAAAQGTGYGSAGLLGTFGNLATPTTTAQGQPYQYYTDQANAAAGGTLSVQQQMSDYLQAEKSFTADMGKLAKGGLSKSLQQQLVAAGPLQGDEEAQSILSGSGGIGAVNKLQKQITAASNQLGIGAAEGVYGYGGVGGKTVSVKANADAAPVHALQSAINQLHGKTVTISVALNIAGSGAGGGGGGIDLTPAVVKQVTAAVQTALLKQAKRTGKTGIQLPGYPA